MVILRSLFLLQFDREKYSLRNVVKHACAIHDLPGVRLRQIRSPWRRNNQHVWTKFIFRNMSKASSNLIVVSNRLPFVLKRTDEGVLYRQSSAGGLVTAVAPIMVRSGGLWVGWPGIEMKDDEKVPESNPGDESPTAGLKSSQVKCVSLTAEEHELYYNGCCNATFWPLFHSMPDRAIFNESYWTAYK